MHTGNRVSDRTSKSASWTPLIILLFVGIGCTEQTRPVTVRGTAAVKPKNVPSVDGSRGAERGGELLFPMPDEQEVISTIQDSGFPADAVGYGSMRFIETTAAGAAALNGLNDLASINISIRDASNADLKHLEKLPTLNGLLVFSRRVTDDGLPQIAGLQSLKYLWIEQAPVTADGLRHLETMTNLESLNIRFRPLSGGLTHLKEMRHLKSLNIPGTKLTNSDLEHVRDLTSLESINIGGSPISDEGVRHLTGLTNLKELHLRGTKITDKGLELLTSLENLEHLNVVLCRDITNAGVEAFGRQVPNCEVRR